MSAADLAVALGGRRVGAVWVAPCPLSDEHANSDVTPSLSITERGGKILVHCQSRHANEQGRVIDALRGRGLWPEREREARIVATYDYRDEAGVLLYQVVRLDPKGGSANVALMALAAGSTTLTASAAFCTGCPRFSPLLVARCSLWKAKKTSTT